MAQQETPPPPKYVRRNPVFFAFAWCQLAAALQPASAILAKKDKDDAEHTAELCARVLDSGEVPKGYVLPEHVRGLILAEQKRVFDDNQARDHEAFREQQRKTFERQGPILKKDEVLEKNASALAGLVGLSELVRETALHAACHHLAARPQVTGAESTRNDAIGIVCEEIERATRLHAQVGNCVKDLSKLSEKEQEEVGIQGYPYATGIAVQEVMLFLRAAQEEAQEAEEGATTGATPDLGRAGAPASGTQPGPGW